MNGIARARRAVRRTSGDRKAIDLDILPSLLGFNIRRAQIALWRRFNRGDAEVDIKPGAFGVLLLAHANPGVAQVELAQELHIDKANMVALIDKLENQGWVVRKRSGEDRRRQGIHLTAAGQRAYRMLKRTVLEHEKNFALRYSDSERVQLLSLLQRMCV